MTNQTIVNVSVAVISLIFLVLTIFILNLSEVKLTKPMEDKYAKAYNKYFKRTSRILAWITILAMLIVFIYDLNDHVDINGITLTSLTFLIIMSALTLFQLAKYLLIHKYTKRWFK